MPTAEEQLVAELGPLADALGALLGTDVGDLVRERAESRARMVVAEVDPGTAVDLATVLWGGRDPVPSWWATPLGLVVAAVLGGDGSPITTQHAADILGVSRGTVAQLVSRGTLTGGPAGVRRGDVMARLCRLRG